MMEKGARSEVLDRNERNLVMNNMGQATIFIIVAIVIVAGIVVFFAIRSGLFLQGVPAEFVPVYNLYSGCIEQETENAIAILGTQGGKIDTGEFIPGSEYAPFSSHLNFLGIPVPYWYYISGNGVVKINAPSKNDMEEEISEFLEQEIRDCDFTEFYEQGFYVSLPDDIEVETKISDNKVEIDVSANVVASREDRGARKTRHKAEIDSRVGSLYESAKDIYNRQLDEAFLEDYAVDVLYSYAPVDGVEVSCAPQIWQTREVTNELKEGLEANIAAIKFRGDYYNLDENEDRYFVVDLGENVNGQVSLLYSKEWPTKVEITPANSELMIAEPIGNQQGLGVLGFCYVPYHFVYDVSFPVLIQISDGFEIFQFPISVIVDNNLPREVDLLTLAEEEDVDVCQFRAGNVRVNTFDSNLRPVEAGVSYKCFDSVCPLGRTEAVGNDAILDSDIPLCFNGQLIVNAEGFVEKKQLFSSNSEVSADVILDREYEVDVEILVGSRGISQDEFAFVNFVGDDGYTSSVVFPENTKVKLKEGSYEVSSYVYGSSGLTVPGYTRVECVEVPKSGLEGLFGGTKEECFNVEIPEVNLDQALVGGGTTSTFILESELQKGKVVIDLGALSIPNSFEQLQYNYESFNGLGVDLNFV